MPITDLHKKKLKKNLTVLAIIAGLCVLIWAVTIVKINRANASEFISAGHSSTYDLPISSPVPVHDIYTRQFEYREEAQKLRRQILARAEDFAETRAAVYAQYRRKLDAYHETITEDNIPSFFETQSD